jgi:hypothetical protein
MKAVRVNGLILQFWRSSFRSSLFFRRRAIFGGRPALMQASPFGQKDRKHGPVRTLRKH